MAAAILLFMERFETSIGRPALAALVWLPPLVYAVTLALVSRAASGEGLPATGLLLLLAMAQGFPLAALVWTFTSVAAWDIEPGRLVAHSVIRDRSYRLSAGMRPPRCQRGSVTAEVEGRRLTIRVADPEACRVALTRAMREG